MSTPEPTDRTALRDGLVGGGLLVGVGTLLLWIFSQPVSVALEVVLLVLGIGCGIVVGRSRRLVRLLESTRRGQHSVLQHTTELNARLAQQVDAQSALLESSRRQLAAAQARALAHTLAAGVMHDLSNMLTLVGAAACDLNTAEDEGVRQRAALHVEQGLNQSYELLRSYRNMLQGRSSGGEVAVRATLEGLLPLLSRGFAPDQELHLAWDASSELLIGMPGHEFSQVVSNLIINGRDALDDRPGRVEVRCRRDKREVVVVVADTGHGMSAEVQARAFEPFFTTKQDRDGTGLGLHVLQELVHSNGGRVELVSEPGLGTEVVVRLPLAAKRDPGAAVVAR
jgi:signal transduction histidine kinase